MSLCGNSCLCFFVCWLFVWLCGTYFLIVCLFGCLFLFVCVVVPLVVRLVVCASGLCDCVVIRLFVCFVLCVFGRVFVSLCVCLFGCLCGRFV